MPAHTQTDDSQAIPDLYRVIMHELEPDLLIENLPLLAQKYGDESATDCAKRKERYATAFAECFARIDVVMAQMKEDSHAFKAHVIDLCRVKENAFSADMLLSLEDSISAL